MPLCHQPEVRKHQEEQQENELDKIKKHVAVLDG